MNLNPPNQLDLAIRGLITDYGKKPTFAEVKAAYSADTIMEGKIRRPFHYRGALHIAGGGCQHRRHEETQITELIPRELFKGKPTTYQQRISRDCGEIARHDPRGFYYGIAVKSGGKDYVLGKETAVLVFEDEKLVGENPPRDRKT